MSNDRDGGQYFLRGPAALLGQWLHRCHLEGLGPDDAAQSLLKRALARTGSVLGEDKHNETEGRKT